MTEETASVSEAAPPVRGGLIFPSILLLLAAALVVLVIGVVLFHPTRSHPASGSAPEFTLTTFAGQPISLLDLRGQVVVLNFWASWCGPCREEAPALQRIWERYQTRGVVVLGVAYMDSESESRAFIEEFGLTYPNGADGEPRISDQYAIKGVPETYIIDQNGQVAAFVFAQVNETDLSAALDRLLAQPVEGSDS